MGWLLTRKKAGKNNITQYYTTLHPNPNSTRPAARPIPLNTGNPLEGIYLQWVMEFALAGGRAQVLS
jgi:hypothetical protein